MHTQPLPFILVRLFLALCLCLPAALVSTAPAPAYASSAAGPLTVNGPLAPAADRTVGAGCTYATIAAALAAANPGDRLLLAGGTSFTTNVVISKNITIQGGYSGCNSASTDNTNIDGNMLGSVISVGGGLTVYLQNLTLFGGQAESGGGLRVTEPSSHVTLDHISIYNNHATFGGAIAIGRSVVVTATNSTLIFNNSATQEGGGVRVASGTFTAADENTILYSNAASSGGSLWVNNGSVYLNGTDISISSATVNGGGIYLEAGSLLEAEGDILINGNTAVSGGGIYASQGSTILLNSGHQVIGFNNSASDKGGGIYLENSALTASPDVLIGSNVGAPGGNKASAGGGIYALDSSVSLSGAVYNNRAKTTGAGIYAQGGTLNLSGARVGGMEANQPNIITVGGGVPTYGAGMYLAGIEANIVDSVIQGNNFEGFVTSAAGGGIHIVTASGLVTSTVSITNSQVINNSVVAPGGSWGGGISIMGKGNVVSLSHTEVSTNTALFNGGGIAMGGGFLTISNGSVINGNDSINGNGAGISLSSAGLFTPPALEISDSTLSGNDAGLNGGALSVTAGSALFTGAFTITGNTALINGGGIAVESMGELGINPTGQSKINHNHASQNGGALYVSNSDFIDVYSWAAGVPLEISENTANFDGGAIYSIGGNQVYLSGALVAFNNSAQGNGGFLSLNGSQAWITDYMGELSPQLTLNHAANGGMLYASGGSILTCRGSSIGNELGGNYATTGSGGAVYLTSSTLSSNSCRFGFNHASNGSGGALYAENSIVDVSATWYGCSAPSQCSSFFNNDASLTAGNGGAIYTSGGPLNMTHTYLHHNSAQFGGAFFQTGPTAESTIANTVIYSNTAANSGAGVRVVAGSLDLMHSTLAGNGFGSPAYAFSQSGGTNVISNTIIWGNSAGVFIAGGALDGVCNIDQSGGNGLIANPLFRDPAAADYRLTVTSPAIDACLVGLTTDLDDLPRPVGPAYDIGAFEYPNALLFAADETGSGQPGAQISYQHVLGNLGSLTDTYSLSASSSQGWTVSFLPSASILLSPNSTTTVNVLVTIPAGSPAGTIDVTTVTATSTNDPALSAMVQDTTTTLVHYDLSLSPNLSHFVAPGAVYTYTHTLKNNSNTADTYNLSFSSTRGWSTLATSTPVTLAAGATRTIKVRVSVPAGTAAGMVDVTTLTATSTGSPGLSRQATSTTTVSKVYAMTFSPNRSHFVAPASVYTYTHTLKNNSNTADTYNLTITSTRGWASLLSAAHFTLAAGASKTISVRVSVPAGTSAGLIDVATITATSTGQPSLKRQVTDTTTASTAGTYGFTLSGGSAQTITAGHVYTYTHTLVNTGTLPDTYNLTLSSSRGWAVLSEPGIITLAPGASVTLHIRVTVPAGTGGLVEKTILTVTSQGSPTKTASATDTTTSRPIHIYLPFIRRPTP